MNLPKVSLLLVVRNEKDYIVECLDSYLKQDYPSELLEVIIVDGYSNDGTRELIEEQSRKFNSKGIVFKFLDNPNKILASGWNIAIHNASSELVCRIDGHSNINPSYIRYGVETLLKKENEQVAGVGGWLTNIGTTVFSEIIVELYANKFAMGGSPFRHCPSDIRETDTAVFAVYRKKTIEKAGMFDEALSRNQDIALHKKLQKLGYYFLTHPEMKIQYHVRSNLKKLLKKAYMDGFWVMKSSKTRYIRHMVPFFFVGYLALLVLWVTVMPLMNIQFLSLLLTIPLITYAGLLVLFSFKAKKLWHKVALIPMIFSYHLAYGFGSLMGFISSLKHTAYHALNNEQTTLN